MNYEFCIVCDKTRLFDNWICIKCGAHSPKGDPCDEELKMKEQDHETKKNTDSSEH